jgi:twitching motility protein PilT
VNDYFPAPNGEPTRVMPPIPPGPAAAAGPTYAPQAGYGQHPALPSYGPPAPVAPATVSAPPPPPATTAPTAPVRSAGPAARIGMTQAPNANDIDLEGALRRMVEMGASDLHMTSGAVPTVRMDGRLLPLDGFVPLMPDSIQRTIYAVLTQKQREAFEADLELDFAFAVRGLARFRVNLYQQRESLGAAFRVIPYEIKPLEALGVPAVVANFANLPRGLVLVTGPTGSGKSTTLASIIDLANRTRSDHIMTVEDPIEFLHRHKKSLINQREVGADTHSFANALKHVLRQDPDIILVGEMRDLETISVALTAAETGHLVFATLHTQDAAQTIDRIIDVFPPGQQDQVRTQLAGGLQAVVCQTLSKKANGPGRVVATEVLIATPAIRNLIREGKTHQMYSAMQAGAQLGMHTMDQHLAELVKVGKITYEQGMEKCHHIEDYNRLTGRTSGGTGGGTNLGAMSGGMGDPLGSAGLVGNTIGAPAAGGGL